MVFCHSRHLFGHHLFAVFDAHMAIVHKLYRVSLVILVVIGLYNVTASSSVLFHKINKRLELDMDDILAPFLSKILRFVIVALGISMIAGEFHYDVNGFVAGLGLGGFAFALAAKDTVGNFSGNCHHHGEAFYDR